MARWHIPLARPWRRRLRLALAIFLGIGLLSTLNAWRRARQHYQVQRELLMPLAYDAARRHQVDPCLIMGVIHTESGWRDGVTGKAGEVGLMQITVGAAQDWERATGRAYGTKARLYAPELNLEIGTWYLARALQRWQDRPDQLTLAIVQYNAGPSRAAALAQKRPENHTADVPIPSTRAYIQKVTSYRDSYRKAGLCTRPPPAATPPSAPTPAAPPSTP